MPLMPTMPPITDSAHHRAEVAEADDRGGKAERRHQPGGEHAEDDQGDDERQQPDDASRRIASTIRLRAIASVCARARMIVAPCQIAGSDSSMQRKRPSTVMPATTTETGKATVNSTGPRNGILQMKRSDRDHQEHRELDQEQQDGEGDQLGNAHQAVNERIDGAARRDAAGVVHVQQPGGIDAGAGGDDPHQDAEEVP